MHPTELLMRRRNVRAFIDADPVDIAISRKGDVLKSDAGGSTRLPPATLASQRARIIQAKRRYNAGLVNSEAGEIPDTDYLLLGMNTLDVQVDDTFMWLGNRYQVKGIHPTRIESTICAIEFDGPPNG